MSDGVRSTRVWQRENWGYLSVGPTSNAGVSGLFRIAHARLTDSTRFAYMGGSFGFRSVTDDYTFYDDRNFLYVEQMTDDFANKQLAVFRQSDSTGVLPISASRWLNVETPPSPQSLRGKVVLVMFWATWCVPWLPHLLEAQSLHARLNPKGLSVIAVHSKPIRGKTEEFLSKHSITLPVALDDGKTSESYQAFGIPVCFLFDKKGHLRFAFKRVTPTETQIQELLDEQ